jgi:hypothetical protein
MTVFLMEHVSFRPDGMVEYWNVGLNKEVAHLLMRLRRINILVKENFFNRSLFCRVFYPLFPGPDLICGGFDLRHMFHASSNDNRSFHESRARAGHHSSIPILQL